MEETEETFCLFSIQLLLDAYVDSGTTRSDSCAGRAFQALRQELGSLWVMQRARSRGECKGNYERERIGNRRRQCFMIPHVALLL